MSTRKQGFLALIAIVLGNLAAILESVEKIRTNLDKLLGLDLSGYLFPIFLLVILIGYILGFSYLYRRYFRSKMATDRRLQQALVVLITLAIGGSAFGVNRMLLQKTFEPEPVLQKSIPFWVDRIFRVQASNGGIRSYHRDKESEPQVWTTAQCLTSALMSNERLEPYRGQIRSAFDFIEKTRRTEGDKGWGYFEYSSCPLTVTEIAAWVALAEIYSVRRGSIWTSAELPKVILRVKRDLEHIVARQDRGGGWSPIGEIDATYVRTYTTIMALWALVEARKSSMIFHDVGKIYDTNITEGISWLLETYNTQLRSWVPNPNVYPQDEVFPGLTAQTLFVLIRAEDIISSSFLRDNPAYIEAKRNFIANQELDVRLLSNNKRLPDRDQHLRPMESNQDRFQGFHLEASTFLWFPWSLATLGVLAKDQSLDKEDRVAASELRQKILWRIRELQTHIESNPMYVLAENLLGISHSFPNVGSRARSNVLRTKSG